MEIPRVSIERESSHPLTWPPLVGIPATCGEVVRSIHRVTGGRVEEAVAGAALQLDGCLSVPPGPGDQLQWDDQQQGEPHNPHKEASPPHHLQLHSLLCC